MKIAKVVWVFANRDAFEPRTEKRSHRAMMGEDTGPFGPLKYLYLGTSNVQKDLDYYTNVLGAKKVWDVSSFGTRVAAVRLGKGPMLLLADHRPAQTCILIFQMDDLEVTARELRRRGWKSEGGKFEIPDGPCYRFNDPSGNPLALLQIVRPNVLGGMQDETRN